MIILIARERNDAVSKLNLEMKNLEKLERERREMLGKIDGLTQEQQRKTSLDVSKNVGDLNMKLKMEIGALRGENEGLLKKNDETRQEIVALEGEIQVNIFKTLQPSVVCLIFNIFFDYFDNIKNLFLIYISLEQER